jgi:hypothetical protein
MKQQLQKDERPNETTRLLSSSVQTARHTEEISEDGIPDSSSFF